MSDTTDGKEVWVGPGSTGSWARNLVIQYGGVAAKQQGAIRRR